MKDLLRIVTAGSVDDGKSTLLGRILADTGQIPEDQMAHALAESARRGHDGLDPSLLLDGLEDERAQGITIDVAYRYFATERRSFVLADAPGHARYTRNMATGAAGCDVALLLVDAERGVGSQTRRHAFVAALMGVRHIVVAVNKMDRVNWSKETFNRIREEVADVVVRLHIADVSFIPVSALLGTNVVERSPHLEWFHGPPLLEQLETMHVASDRNLVDLRFPVQLILPLVDGERRISGTLSSGVLRNKDEILVLPSGERSIVTSLHSPRGPIDEAFAGQAISLTLDRELDVARGDVLVHPNNRARVTRKIDTTVVWMDEAPLALERSYFIRLGMRWASASIREISYRLDIETGHRVGSSEVSLNDIARIQLELDEAIVLDEFRRVRELGSLILVDRDTLSTAAAGVVIDRGEVGESSPAQKARIVWFTDTDENRLRAAQLATDLKANGRIALRLNASVLEPVVGNPLTAEGRARSLEAARLIAASGSVPIVILTGDAPDTPDVVHVGEQDLSEILARIVV